MQLRVSGFDPRLVDLLNRLQYTPIGDDLVVRLMSLAHSQSEISPEEKAAALRPFLWFLDRVADDGLPLTSADTSSPTM